MMFLLPSEIRYCKNSISNRFRDGRLIGKTLDDLCECRIRKRDLPPISVKCIRGNFISNNNRRLWVFKQLQKRGMCGRIPCFEIDYISSNRMTSHTGGSRIDIRGDPGGNWWIRDQDTKIMYKDNFNNDYQKLCQGFVQWNPYWDGFVQYNPYVYGCVQWNPWCSR